MDNIITWDDLEFQEHIGEGGFGTVNRVTFKKPFKGFTEAAAKSVYVISKEEVEIMRKMNHPNIVLLLAYLTKGPITFIILEYAPNGSLHDYLKDKSKPLPEELMRKWLGEAALAIAYLHEQNFLHRDIKANNCLLFKDDILKLCDFGLARELEHSQSTSSMKGTCRYLAPEIIMVNDEGRAIYSKPADIYAYGMLMLEIYTRKPPFEVLQSHAVIYRVGNGEQPKIPEDCPQLLSEMMKHCWNRDPRGRPPIKEILTALPTIFTRIPLSVATRTKADMAIGGHVEEPSESQSKSAGADSGCGSLNCMNISGSQRQSTSSATSTDSGIRGLSSSEGSSSHDARWKLIQEFGKKGDGIGEMSQADGIALCGTQDIVVTDTAVGEEADNKVLVFSSKGGYKHSLKSHPSDPAGKLLHPTKVAVTSNNNIVITDQSTDVKIFDLDGSFVKSFSTLAEDEKPVSSVNAFAMGVAVGSQDEIIIGDRDRQYFTIHSQYGEFIKQIPTTIIPFHLATNSSHLIIISDMISRKVIAMTRDGTVMYIVHRFIVEGMPGSPDGILCDSNDDKVFIAVRALDESTGDVIPYTGHIHQYDNNGAFVRCIIRSLYAPRGLAMSKGNLFIANTKSVLVYGQE